MTWLIALFGLGCFLAGFYIGVLLMAILRWAARGDEEIERLHTREEDPWKEAPEHRIAGHISLDPSLEEQARRQELRVEHDRAQARDEGIWG